MPTPRYDQSAWHARFTATPEDDREAADQDSIRRNINNTKETYSVT
jgi:hypothetical protein